MKRDNRQPELFAAMGDVRPGKERSAADRYREPSLLDAIREAPAREVITGCVCRPGGKTCTYHATLNRIIDSGVSLEDRLAVVNHSTIVDQQHEAAIIRAAIWAKKVSNR